MSLSASDSSAASFDLGSSASWLSVNPTTGTTPAGSVTVTADPSGLAAGQYTGTITATAPGYIDDTIDVTLTVVAPSTGYAQDPVTGLVSIEAENFDSKVIQGGHDWTPVSPGGSSGSGALEATPNTGTLNNSNYESSSPRLDYLVNFTQVGTHYVWLRGIGATGSDDSAHVGLNGSGQSTSDRISSFSTALSWSNDTMDSARATINVSAPGEQVLNLWMREDGFVVDKIVLTTDANLDPTSFGVTGPPESPRGEPQPALQFSAATMGYTADEGDTAPQQR